MKTFCIVIPTHERPVHLRRCLFYYQNFGCKVVVCDSSKTAYEGDLASHVHYLHMPGLRFSEKMIAVLDGLSDEFVAVSPDDDFLFSGALARAAAMLKANPAWQACVGDVLAFPEGRPLEVTARCDGRAANAVASSPARNVQTYLSHYHQILWSLFRRDTLKLAYDVIRSAEFDNDNFFELVVATVCAGHGGIAYLKDYWILREITERDHWGSRHPSITKARLASMKRDIDKYTELIDRATFEGAGRLSLSSYLSAQEAPQGLLATMARGRGWAFRHLKALAGQGPAHIDVVGDERFQPIRHQLNLRVQG